VASVCRINSLLLGSDWLVVYSSVGSQCWESSGQNSCQRDATFPSSWEGELTIKEDPKLIESLGYLEVCVGSRLDDGSSLVLNFNLY